MRLNILAFACGVLFLQMQGELPAPSVLAALFVLAVLGIGLACTCSRAWLRRPVLPLCCVFLGFAWAGSMAQLRLADALPEAWESKDIQLTGIVASLPQRFERGERFVFDVEAVHTPGAVVPGRVLLSWYRHWDEPDDSECT